MKAIEAPSGFWFPEGTRKEDLWSLRWSGPEKNVPKVEENGRELAKRTYLLTESEASAGSRRPTCDWREHRRLVSTREVQVLHNSDVVIQIIELKIFKLYFVLLNNC